MCDITKGAWQKQGWSQQAVGSQQRGLVGCLESTRTVYFNKYEIRTTHLATNAVCLVTAMHMTKHVAQHCSSTSHGDALFLSAMLLTVRLYAVSCCAQVREAFSVLDLDVDVRPCPKGGAVWRNKAIELGGTAQFPYLVDENTGKWCLAFVGPSVGNKR